MSDTISRQEAIEWVKNLVDINRYYHPHSRSEKFPVSEVIDVLERIPSAGPERKKGKWLEMRYCDYYVSDLQTCRCSECGRYDIRPYLYYFQKPNFCSWCGAEMKGEAE